MPECANRLLKLFHLNNPSWFVNENNSTQTQLLDTFNSDIFLFSPVSLCSQSRLLFYAKIIHCLIVDGVCTTCASVYLSFISLRFVFLVQFTERDRITNFKWLIEVNGFMAVAEISSRWAFRRFFKCVSLVILSLALLFRLSSRLKRFARSQWFTGSGRNEPLCVHLLEFETILWLISEC